MPILDQYGRPWPDTPGTRPAATISAHRGDRQEVYPAVSRGINPGTMANILDNAAEGDNVDFLSMAEEMEETDLHYYSMLSTRKLAVTGAPRELEPADDSAEAKEIADACTKSVLDKPIFGQLLYDLLDSLGKGYSVVQPIWDVRTRPWTYREFRYTDPRWFTFRQETGLRTILLRSDDKPEGEPLRPGRYITHAPLLKSGIPTRSGFARLAAIVFMLKKYTLKDWAAFMEVFGMPTRLGKYDPETTTDTQKGQLIAALRLIGHDAAAIIPEGMEIEVLDTKRPSGGDSLFSGFADYLDKQMSKGILGQTMTADNGGSLAQAKVHNEVRQDILAADASQLESVIQESVIAPWVLYNYGPDAPVPLFSIHVEPPEDLELFTRAALPWVQAGLKVEAPWVREKLGIPEPADGATDLLGETSAEGPEPGDPTDGGPKAPEVAENARVPAPVRRAEERGTDLAEQWREDIGQHGDVIQQMAENSASYEEFLAKLKDAEEDFDSDMFVRRLALEMARVRGLANA